MTIYHQAKRDTAPRFMSAKEARKEPKPARSDAEIEAEMKARIQRNLSTYRMLAKL